MKKTLSTIALMAVMLISTSGYNRGNATLETGSNAPDFQVSNNTQSTTLSLMQGDYVLLSFWNSADAASRVECNRYSAWARNCQTGNVRHVALNFDSDPQLFEEIVRRDKLDQKAQFNVSGPVAERIIRDYGLTEGMGTILIGPDGRIIDFNPSTTELSSLI